MFKKNVCLTRDLSLQYALTRYSMMRQR